MAMVLDHTIVPVQNREKSVEFYSRILGFEDVGEVGPFLAVRVNEIFNLDFIVSGDFSGKHHYAFAMEPAEFEAAFARIREAGITYGDGPRSHDNMQGPGMTMGSQGMGKAVYFADPDGHLLEIKTY